MVFHSPFPDVDIPKLSLPQFIFERSKHLGEKVALIDGSSNRTISYQQLFEAIRLVASGLAAKGFKKGDVFAIYSPNLPEYAIAFHAVATLGGINTTVNPLYTPEELLFQLKDAKATYLLTIPQFMDKALAVAEEAGLKEIFVFGETEGATPFADLLKSDGHLPEVHIDPEKDLVVLPYSSGTTGLPKGVMLTHHNLVSNICQCGGVKSDAAIRSDDTLLGILPFYHIYGMVVIMNYALAEGASIVTLPRFELEPFLQTMQRYEISYAHLVPPIVLALAKHPLVDKYPLPKLRVIFSGAAPLGGNVAEECRKRLGCWIQQGYGMTGA
ncbi:MAG: AMP-binding protein [Deinococcales bacterium]